MLCHIYLMMTMTLRQSPNHSDVITVKDGEKMNKVE